MSWNTSKVTPDPFVGWLLANGLLQPGTCWSTECTPHGPVYRRYADFGPGWPKEKIAGPLVVRPKRKTLEALIP